jgi:hypothetical protein
LVGALAVGGAGVVGVVLVQLLDPPEHAVTPMATEAPIHPDRHRCPSPSMVPACGVIHRSLPLDQMW